MSDIALLPQKDFAKSFAAYQADLQNKLNRAPTSQEVMDEMLKFGWEFTSASENPK